jgi:hypothetical protein
MSQVQNSAETVIKTRLEIKDVEWRVLSVPSKLVVGVFLQLYLPGPGLLWTPTSVKVSNRIVQFEDRFRRLTLAQLAAEIDPQLDPTRTTPALIEFYELRFLAERTDCDDGGVSEREWNDTWRQADNSVQRSIQNRIDHQMSHGGTIQQMI